MKEQVQVVGVRESWYGDDLLSLQTEALEPLQKFFSRFGAIILQGCEITDNGADWDISAGIVGIAHADGYKLARFEAVTAVALPGYLSIDKSVAQDDYGTGVDDVSYEYTAVFTPGVAPGGSPDYLVMPLPSTGDPANFDNGLARTSIPEWQTMPSATRSPLFVGAGDVNLSWNKAARLLYIRGSAVMKNNPSSISAADNVQLLSIADFASMSLPLPSVRQYFIAHFDYRSSAGNYFKDVNNSDYIKQLNGYVDPADGLNIGFIKPVSTVTEYTIYFNAVILID